MNFIIKFTVVFCATVFLAVVGYSSYNVLALGNLACTEEDGCLEIWQAAVLAISFAFFIAAVFCKNNGERAITLFCAVICYAGFLREVDFDKMGLGAFADFMLYGGGRYATIILGFAVSLGWAAFKWREYLKISIRFVVSARGLSWLVAALLKFVAQEFEYSSLSYAQFFEEIAELIAYNFILASSLMSLRMACAVNHFADRPK